jgi:hypothetical protein
MLFVIESYNNFICGLTNFTAAVISNPGLPCSLPDCFTYRWRYKQATGTSLNSLNQPGFWLLIRLDWQRGIP